MINSKQLLRDFISKLSFHSTQEDLNAIGSIVFENVLNISRNDLLLDKALDVRPQESQRLHEIAARLNANEPLQYILNEAYFFGRKFYVDPAVLIPRPETEELVNAVIERCRGSKRKPRILDIGTGSGCIPVTLALEIPGASVFALDKSKAALKVASRNAKTLGAKVNFFEHDILTTELSLGPFDVIVSNPPYIPLEEMSRMQPNVTDFEPHIALFVENNDPMVFYAAIAKTGLEFLTPEGFIAVEINERFGQETAATFKNFGYESAEILKDISGKDRIVVATK